MHATGFETAPASRLALMSFWPTRRGACFDCLCRTPECC